jgi:SAM-dependent methyltransferase
MKDQHFGTNAINYWSTIAKRWNADHPQKLWRLYSDTINSELIVRWLPSSDRFNFLLKTDLFDEAFGKGLFSILESQANNMIGIDISPSIVNRASEQNSNFSGITADLRRLPFNSETFDVVISNSSLDHFKTRREISIGLHEIHRILRKGGQLIITFDNLANPIIALRSIIPFRLLNRSGIVPYYVGATLHPHRLYQILEKSGFKVYELEAIMHCPRVIAVVLSRLFGKYTGKETQKRFLGALKAFERLSGLPTRFLTGYFVAAKAVKC